jgi:hypothetical protein
MIGMNFFMVNCLLLIDSRKREKRFQVDYLALRLRRQASAKFSQSEVNFSVTPACISNFAAFLPPAIRFALLAQGRLNFPPPRYFCDVDFS